MLLSTRFLEALHQPLFLLGDGHLAIVEQNGIWGLLQGGHLAVRIDVVTLLYILQNILVVSLHTFTFQLVIATLGAHLCRSGNKNLKLSIRENHRSDITLSPVFIVPEISTRKVL